MNVYVDAIIAGGGAPEICYHGTNANAAQAILKGGFLPDTWFAPNLADALKFGGLHIFSVVFDNRLILPGAWQWHVPYSLPADRIIAYTIFEKHEKYTNTALRDAIFKAAQDEWTATKENQPPLLFLRMMKEIG